MERGGAWKSGRVSAKEEWGRKRRRGREKQGTSKGWFKPMFKILKIP